MNNPNRLEYSYTVDPENGYERVFHSLRPEIEYSLVSVPHGDKFYMQYMKPNLGINFKVTKTIDSPYPNHWNLQGLIDPDIFSFLFRVERPRRFSMPPVVTSGNIEDAGKYGTISTGFMSNDDHPLYAVNLDLRVFRLLRLFNSLWKPGVNGLYQNANIPDMRLQPDGGMPLLLPQKFAVPRTIDSVSLAVVRSV